MKTVEKIHACGKSFFSYPYKIYYTDAALSDQAHLIISVPKKIFKRAVKRNLIRRRIREAFRLDSGLLQNVCGRDILIVYVSSEIFDYGKIKDTLRQAMLKIE